MGAGTSLLRKSGIWRTTPPTRTGATTWLRTSPTSTASGCPRYLITLKYSILVDHIIAFLVDHIIAFWWIICSVLVDHIITFCWWIAGYSAFLVCCMLTSTTEAKCYFLSRADEAALLFSRCMSFLAIAVMGANSMLYIDWSCLGGQTTVSAYGSLDSWALIWPCAWFIFVRDWTRSSTARTAERQATLSTWQDASCWRTRSTTDSSSERSQVDIHIGIDIKPLVGIGIRLSPSRLLIGEWFWYFLRFRLKIDSLHQSPQLFLRIRVGTYSKLILIRN